MAAHLFASEGIVTTEARAKAVRPMVEHAITIAKKETLAGRRILAARL
ncbi:MAG: bL17 family ribosomal protein, partial [Actinobacteria bacterium]|nr:bL17 family ribosomal protein [Actinomycetota bacterium]